MTRHVWIWPDAPDRDPPVTLFDGAPVADWLRWGSTKGECNVTDTVELADDGTAAGSSEDEARRVFVLELKQPNTALLELRGKAPAGRRQRRTGARQGAG